MQDSCLPAQRNTYVNGSEYQIADAFLHTSGIRMCSSIIEELGQCENPHYYNRKYLEPFAKHDNLIATLATASEEEVNSFVAESISSADIARQKLQDAGFMAFDDKIYLRAKLFEAVLENNIDVIQAFIKIDFDLNEQEERGINALMFASSANNNIIVKVLLDAGVKVSIANMNGYTPLMYASQNVNFPMMQALIKAGADLNAINNGNNTALTEACFRGHTEVVRFLINAGADVNITSNNQHSPLMVASALGHIEIVKMLLDAGADVNLKKAADPKPEELEQKKESQKNKKPKKKKQSKKHEKISETPMYCEDRSNFVVDIITKNIMNTENTLSSCTALYYASINGHKEIAQMLMHTGRVTEVGFSMVSKLINTILPHCIAQKLTSFTR